MLFVFSLVPWYLVDRDNIKTRHYYLRFTFSAAAKIKLSLQGNDITCLDLNKLSGILLTVSFICFNGLIVVYRIKEHDLI